VRRSLWLIVAFAAACTGDSKSAPKNSDSAFAAVKDRGRGVMGVDQDSSAHVFEDLPDGGRIVLDQKNANDAAAIATIRQHMRSVADDFRAGNFTKPFAVHAQQVPGTGVMAAKRAKITYRVADRPSGAEVRIKSTDAGAVSAVHAFLEFQRSDHRAAGHEDMDPAEHALHMAPRAACGPPLSKGAKSGSVTTLSFVYGDTVKLTDEPARGDGQVEYKYRGFDGAIGYHVVELVLWGGTGTWYEAYDACTGKKLVIDDAPVVSRDSTRFVTVGHGTPREALSKRIQVLTRQGERDFSVEWDFEVPMWAKQHSVTLDWGPVNPRWTGSGSLKFDRVDKSGKRVGGATAVLQPGGWQFAIDTTAGRGE
jgi:hypothetical protein